MGVPVHVFNGFACSALIVLGGCQRSNETAPQDVAEQVAPFEDVTEASGIDMVTISGSRPSTQIVEVKGGGLALIDFDRDGDRDLFVPNGATLESPELGPGARLFRNNGMMQFEDVTDQAGIDHHRWSYGVAVGDIDGNGFDDIYIGCLGPDVLLKNRGDGTFEDGTAQSGLGLEGWTTGAAFGDLDQDGDLDLFVTRYLDFDVQNPPPPTRFNGIEVLNGPRGLTPLADVVYENIGNGVFRRYEGKGALGEIEPRYGLNLALADFTGDGRLDVLVGNDSQANSLYHNVSEDGRGLLFEEIGMESGLATNMNGYEQATMGIAIADINGDALPDVFSSNFSSDSNTLHVSANGGRFNDRTQNHGLALVSRPYLGWASGFYDFDHDGDEDLLVFNGHVYPQATPEAMDSSYEQPALFFERVGPRFALADMGEALSQPRRDRSAVFDDLDGDGDIDVVVTELNGPIRLLQNNMGGPGWVTLELVDERSGVGNRHAVGAKLKLQANDWEAYRWILGGGPFQSNWSPVVHAAVPNGADEISVTVTWPDGQIDTVPVSIDAHTQLRRTEDGIEKH